MVARLTPDQKVGSSNLSGLSLFSLLIFWASVLLNMTSYLSLLLLWKKVTSDTQYLGPKCETSHQCYASPSPLHRGRPGPSVHETATEALMRRWECSDAIRLGMRTRTDAIFKILPFAALPGWRLDDAITYRFVSWNHEKVLCSMRSSSKTPRKSHWTNGPTRAWTADLTVIGRTLWPAELWDHVMFLPPCNIITKKQK